jgi:quinol monooxygenase YgiN
MMIVIQGAIRVPAAKLAQARPVMQGLVRATREEDGCIAYHFAEDVSEPGLIVIAETWRDQAALDAHFNSPHFAAWVAGSPGLEVSDMKLTVFEAVSAKAL